MNLNCASLLNINNNIPLKSGKLSNSYITSSVRSDDFKMLTYPKNYYVTQVSFGSKLPSANIVLQRIGEENFPNHEIITRLKDIGELNNFSLYDIHMKHYKGLLNCTTLDEAKDIDIESLAKKVFLEE